MADTTTTRSLYRPALNDLLVRATAECIGCDVCIRECAFLRKYGSPKEIARSVLADEGYHLSRAFECSLCGLCAAVCPKRIDPGEMFLEMRREAFDRGSGSFEEHTPLLRYERMGTSRRFTLYCLPEGCDTIFFPGCALSGTRPEFVKQVFAMLQKIDPGTGIVFDCCMKPSYSLGRDDHSKATFKEMQTFLIDHGVEKILAACPNCYSMFAGNGRSLNVGTIYETLAENGIQAKSAKGLVTVHDPCVTRNTESVHRAVRSLLQRQGLDIEEMPHSGTSTLCCGDGGGVNLLAPDMSERWSTLRRQEAKGRRIVTYCAGCTNTLGRHTPCSHVLDVFFEPEKALAGKIKCASAPFTYLNRLALKKSFKRMDGFAVIRERTFIDEQEQPKKRFNPTPLILIILAAVITGVHLSGASGYLQQERLRELIAGHGALAPAIYVLIYTIAPVLFLPGLPITIAGGIMFGPFWGVVYTIIGSTMGACLAFLTARYLARDWVARKLSGPKWERLDRETEKHGWKMVAFTRLIPAFPFNLLNYAFGLTKVPFIHYMLTTFVCMLPACIAFIVFSSSLLDLVRGSVSPEALIGIGLIVLVSLIPVIYRRFRGRRQKEGIR